ncbi:ricin-type beta-trefoil lectin domain protein [Streptomyces sp. NPDC059989]|uniref:RICIN domain-containing protein n=1 Tax=Streptomyces sp. NPDC059989 TaxID=3347026 RepID=UPI0036B6F419
MLKKVAAMGAATALCWGLGTSPANATSSYRHLENMALRGECLDFRADYGPYTTDCNQGAYQTWLMATFIETPTALRQNASSRLCLVARNGQPTMKPCSASDPAALWTVHDTDAAGYQVINNVTKTCLVAGSGEIHHVTLGTCNDGPSRQWLVYS